MRTLWETRIAHLDRRLMCTRLRGLQRLRLKVQVKSYRGLPSRNLPSELVFEQLRLKIDARLNADCPDIRQKLERLASKVLHTRLMERKRLSRAAARGRARPGVHQTRIYLWRRRLAWLRDAESRR